ncbi:TraB/GumN family protein [Wenzhouxiangella sp. XN201]|uniref:TraB/GumN family protein n=1 Tax=Wenzhouxiangella sp. XN201 TaxID=2710755 RepID=UPI0013C78B1E|nr:TraB/GumN family protein [Wenzhouxiangella sp. XN201]NEZ04207.1 TraB/GumN family protein [Wenzhouxiangella sp. XN201]
MRAVRRILFALIVLLPLTAQAQVFWSLTDEAGRQNWLLGTVHSEDPRLLDWPEPLVDALQQADRLALELVPNAAVLERLQQAMMFRDGRLSEVLDEDLYARVVELLVTHYGLTETAVDRMRPWAVAVTLATPPPETGMFMDLMLSVRAQGAGADVVALETFDEQIGFLTGFAPEEQIALIRQAVSDHERQLEIFERLIAAYLDGDLERLARLAESQMDGLPEPVIAHFNEAGLAARNRRMLERAEPWLESGGLIIAVGALHLPGEEGLVAMLRERGWILEPVY